MAMTKAERAEVEVLRTKLALRWSGMPAPERMPVPQRGYVNGWDFNPYTQGRVYPAWTEPVVHGRDAHRTDDGTSRTMTGSQNGVCLYATKREALIALRLAKEEEFAAALRRIDAMIEEDRS